MAETPFDQPYRGGFAGAEHRFALTVYFEDTDTAGVVYYANYLKFMERARSDMLLAAGIDQRGAMEGGEGVYVVAEAHIKYKGSARLGDDLLIVSTVEEVRAASVLIHQQVRRGHELLASADITAAFLGPGMRPRRQPKDWTRRFEQLKKD